MTDAELGIGIIGMIKNYRLGGKDKILITQVFELLNRLYFIAETQGEGNEEVRKY
jgi:hypothetical protein